MLLLFLLLFEDFHVLLILREQASNYFPSFLFLPGRRVTLRDGRETYGKQTGLGWVEGRYLFPFGWVVDM
jgi:hypothetical protein